MLKSFLYLEYLTQLKSLGPRPKKKTEKKHRVVVERENLVAAVVCFLRMY